MQLEFKYLSWISGDDSYAEAAERVMEVLRREVMTEGIAPILIK